MLIATQHSDVFITFNSHLVLFASPKWNVCPMNLLTSDTWAMRCFEVIRGLTPNVQQKFSPSGIWALRHIWASETVTCVNDSLFDIWYNTNRPYWQYFCCISDSHSIPIARQISLRSFKSYHTLTEIDKPSCIWAQHMEVIPLWNAAKDPTNNRCIVAGYECNLPHCPRNI